MKEYRSIHLRVSGQGLINWTQWASQVSFITSKKIETDSA